MAIGKQIGHIIGRICTPHDPTTTSLSSSSASSDDDQDDALTDATAATAVPVRKRSPNELCIECSKLEVRAMLDEERAEISMGSLSDHLNPDCPFCHLISEVVRVNWGPSWSSERLCADPPDGRTPNLFVQSRSPLSIMRGGRLEYPEPRLLMAMDVTPPGYTENRRVIREVDRVKDRFIIAEIESVPGEYDRAEGRQPQLVPRREVGQAIDYALVRSWLGRCMDTHQHTQDAREQMNFDMFHSREGFRLIDLERESLVLVKESCPFAALSYVWGRLPTVLYPGEFDDGHTPVLLTTVENLEALSAPGGLSPSYIDGMSCGAKLPRTVVDAMAFCRAIGMRYLWIDTLCIVQNDRRDKDFMIQCMDDVYGHASVTLIAADGDDADYGLRGVSERHGRPISPFTIVDDGITEHLSLCPPSLGEEVRTSVWNTRGWTFQEQALSQRCLYFTREELFFNCIQCQWREAYDLEDIPDPATAESPVTADRRDGSDIEIRIRTGPPWWNRKLRKDLDPTPYHYLGDLTGTLTLKDYQAAVQDYSRKRLSFPDDVLNAFEGVFNRFTKGAAIRELTLHQTQGIPVNHLHQALLWFPSEQAVPRKCANPEVTFSTWTWAAWDGPIEFVFADSMWISRNISQVPLKKVPLHVLILCWYYGGTTRKFWSQDMWRVICDEKDGDEEDVNTGTATTTDADTDTGTKVKKRPTMMKKHEATDALRELRAYAQGNIGVSVDELLAKVTNDEVHNLAMGELGFIGAYLNAGDASLVHKDSGAGSSSDPRVHDFTIGKDGAHRGEFRFDEEAGEVDEFVAVVTSDTVPREPVTQSIFLGLQTVDGVSRRVGVGFVYYSQDEADARPPWKYKFFRLN